MILGIDLSTSISGYAVLNDDGELIESHAVDTRNSADHVYEAAEENWKYLSSLTSMVSVDHVFMEKNLQTFRTGFSSAQTLSKLSKINGIICYKLYREREELPTLLNPRTARKEAGLTMSNDKKKAMKQKLLREGKSKSYADSKKTKMVVHEYVQDTESNFDFEWTHAGNPKPSSFDRADAIIIARAGEQRLKS